MNQYQLNNEIEEFIKKKDSKGESYSDADIAYIKQHEGKGGQGKHGASGQGVDNQFFTPKYICSLMWQLAVHYGYDDGTVLEPSCGTGRLLADAPDKSKCTGIELNPDLFRIAKISYPQAKIYNNFFEDVFLQTPLFRKLLPKKQLTWLEQYPFSLVIGNPPYGIYQHLKSTFIPTPKMKTIELFFIYWGLRLLKKGGLLIYLQSQNVLRNGIKYNSEKKAIAEIAEFVDAYRLPGIFEYSEVPPDIIILRKL